MSRALLILWIGVLIGQPSYTEPVKDLPGWTNTRWGMSLNQLRKIHPEITIGLDNHGFTAAKLPDVRVGDATLHVFLEFKDVGGQAKVGQKDPPQTEWRLNRVELVAPESACYHLVETLTAKYGQPARNERDFHLWILPSTTIRLVVSPASVETNECLVIYHPTEKSDSL